MSGNARTRVTSFGCEEDLNDFALTCRENVFERIHMSRKARRHLVLTAHTVSFNAAFKTRSIVIAWNRECTYFHV
jgi:hypothetical protein